MHDVDVVCLFSSRSTRPTIGTLSTSASTSSSCPSFFGTSWSGCVASSESSDAMWGNRLTHSLTHLLSCTRTFLTFFTHLQIPGVKHVYHEITPWLAFETTWATVGAAAFQLYYFALEPLGAVSSPFIPYLCSCLVTSDSVSYSCSISPKCS